MVTIRIRDGEACAADPFLLWDSVWSPLTGRADWALADQAEVGNAGGLQATAGLETAIILCLFVDRRVPADHPLAWLAGDDRRGWWGDAVRQTDEAEMGSLLWLLERAPLDANTARWAQSLAIEALAPLVAQAAAVRVEAEAIARQADNRLDLAIALYGRNGERIYARQFERLWQQMGLA